MIKTSKLFTGLVAIALFAACSNDEPATGGNDANKPAGGEKAYMAVTISSAGDINGRSTDFDNPKYELGDEHTVDNVQFFFFDENGNFVLRAADTQPEFNAPTNDQDKNIEWIDQKCVLVLEDLTSNDYPMYMMTVINMKDFEPAATLTQTSQKLSYYADNFGTDKKNFVMTTSSYKGNDANHDNKYYCVTALTPDDFKTTAEEALDTDNPVDVYVERLAAKVRVNVNPTNAKIELAGNRVIYKLEQTVAGNDNNNGNQDGNANTPIYIEVIGWGLNATAKDSYMSKQFVPEWLTTDPFAEWNSSTRFRSFWAMSRMYNAAENEYDQLLNYNKMSAFTTNVGGAQYCYENTNLGTVVAPKIDGTATVDNSKVTHVVLNTRICDENGNELDMVKYRGALFLKDAFLSYVLNTLNHQNAGLNYYIKTSATETENTYRQVSIEDLKLQGVTGKFEQATVKLAYTGNLYKKNVDETGKETYTVITNPDLAERLAGFTTNNPLYWYNGGANIYFIPIEHNAPRNAAIDTEGYYGVVRNHLYDITINSFSRVGHAVYDPDNGSEEIKPDEPEDPLYYVGAKINVLSWRIINQTVDL